jgi:hypothetical protein
MPHDSVACVTWAQLSPCHRVTLGDSWRIESSPQDLVSAHLVRLVSCDLFGDLKYVSLYLWLRYVHTLTQVLVTPLPYKKNSLAFCSVCYSFSSLLLPEQCQIVR